MLCPIPMRWVPFVILAFLVGCSATRSVTISTDPPDANLLIDGRPRGRGPISEVFSFTGQGDSHRVLATRDGYNDQEVQISPNFGKELLVIKLRPQTRLVTLNISPVPANVEIDGDASSSGPVSQIRRELPFPMAPSGGRITHTVHATLPGYERAEQIIRWGDPNTEYVLELRPSSRVLKISTEPPGAEISINDLPYGQSPITYPDQGQGGARSIRATKPGYAAATLTIPAGDKRQEFTLTLQPLGKMIHLVTNPPGGKITLADTRLIQRPDGSYAARLEFKPTNERGETPTYAGEAQPPADATNDYKPQKFSVGWDEGKSGYVIDLPKVTSRDMPLVELLPERMGDRWALSPRQGTVAATVSTDEATPNKSLVQITHLAAGTLLDSFALSADGNQLLLVTLTDGGKHSIMWLAPADGSGPPREISDGQHLDLTPTFTPDGQQIVFSSDRGGGGMSLWTATAAGGDMKPLTAGEAHGLELWPTVDASPNPRVFYQSIADDRTAPTIMVRPLGGGDATDLHVAEAQQPRIGPKADAIVFAQEEGQSGKRDLFRVSDQGARPSNLTRAPNTDDRDAAWSWDGRRIVFSSDRASPANGPANYDIWLFDLATARQPIQLTSNASRDDCPIWDVMGRAVFFRSNRGGEWQIWKITLP